MHTYIHRIKEKTIKEHLRIFPAVAILGARQVGKSTLAKQIMKEYPNSVYLDLEDPRDLAKLQDPMAFLQANKNSMICIDEIQRFPNLFNILRPYIDGNERPGQLLILGSASKELIRQSSESLAGRISFIEIGPFSVPEVNDLRNLWMQGGFPKAYILNEQGSYDWRINYIRTFLERDIPQFGINIPAETLRRFWTMLAHVNGTVLNMRSLASSMGTSAPTIKRYLDILESAFVIRRLQPFYTNTKKRLVKSPKLYIRDSGIIHTLLGIETLNDLLGHPCLGGSYESFIISSIMENFPRFGASFYRSSGGAEIDLILEKGKKRTAIEIKSSSSPKLTQGFYEAMKIIKPEKAFIAAPVEKPFPVHKDIWVYNLPDLISQMKELYE